MSPEVAPWLRCKLPTHEIEFSIARSSDPVRRSRHWSIQLILFFLHGKREHCAGMAFAPQIVDAAASALRSLSEPPMHAHRRTEIYPPPLGHVLGGE